MPQINLKEEAERRYPLSLASESISDSLRQIIINMIRLAFVDGCEYMAEKVKEMLDKSSKENYVAAKDAMDNHYDYLVTTFSASATEDIELMGMVDELIGKSED